jgi:hypothetical protein
VISTIPGGTRFQDTFAMATYLLCHRHEAAECPVAFAAWTGFDSPLRHKPALSSCATCDHRLWFVVEARDDEAALGQLPQFLAVRSKAVKVSEVTIP